MGKEAYIILGRGMSIKSEPINKITKYFNDGGIKPYKVDISWKYKVMSDYIEQFNKFYEENHKQNNETYLFGFSWGAMISLISSQSINPKVQILCSLSPYFEEDLRRLPRLWRIYIGKKRLSDFESYSFNKIIKNVKSNTIFIAGREESENLIKRVKDAKKRLRNSKLLIVEGGKHRLDEIYLNALEKLISEI